MPKVSVIVPVYGVEKYIERCAKSLFEQTLDDMEFLFIDDCTPDRSIEILKQVLEMYPQRKSQVVIHRMENNMGQAAVRRWGIQHATGDFIIHCDSDDWVDGCLYRTMIEAARNESSDIVICDIKRTDGNGYLEIEKGCHTTDVREFYINVLFHKDNWSLCNKLIKSSLYNDIIFPTNNMGEDMAIFLQLIQKVKKISYTPQASYYYFINPLSITNNRTEDQIYDRFIQIVENVKLIVNKVDSINDSRVKSGLNHLIWSQKEVLLPLIHIKLYYKIWRNTFAGVEKEILFDNKQKLHDRLKCLLTILHIYPWKKY